MARKNPKNKYPRARSKLDAKAIRGLAEKGCTPEEIAKACNTRWQAVDAILNGVEDKGGQPRKECDPELIERLAEIGCTTDEIANVCGVSKDTIERNYMEQLHRGRERGKASVRRMQWKLAQDGNPTMQIWLGKQLLGQRDKTELTGAEGGPVQYVVRMPEGVSSVDEWLQKSK